MRTTLFGLAILFGLFFASRATAEAALRVCDSTNEPVSVAIAVLEPNSTNGAQSQSEGWFHIDARACAIVIDTDLDPTTHYYLYAKSTNIVWAGNSTIAQDGAFCTNFSGRFAYVDRTLGLCTGAGQQMLWFIYEPAAAPNWTIQLGS